MAMFVHNYTSFYFVVNECKSKTRINCDIIPIAPIDFTFYSNSLIDHQHCGLCADGHSCVFFRKTNASQSW